MTALAEHPRLRAVGRLVLLVAAIALTTWGVGLIAFSDTVRGTRLGIPVAFWGVLLGYTAIRVNGDRAASLDTEVVTAASSPLPPPVSGELVRERDQAMWHEYELQLEVMLRRELEQVLRTELSGLRRDVAELRSDVLDAVDGRLQLERVEITRIIGSNLAALQDDGRISASHDENAAGIRRAVQGVGVVGEPGSWAPATSAGARPAGPVLPAMADGGSAAEAARPSEPEPQTSPSRSNDVGGPGFRPDSSSRVPSRPAGSLPFRSPEPVPLTPPVLNSNPDVEADPVAESSSAPPRSAPSDPHVDPEPTPSRSSDPFALLPRLSVFRLPDLPAGTSLAQPEPAEAEPAVTEVVSPVPAGNGYVGRRRHAVAVSAEADLNDVAGRDVGSEADDEPPGPPSGRHGAAPGTVSSAVRTDGSGASARPVAHRR